MEVHVVPTGEVIIWDQDVTDRCLIHLDDVALHLTAEQGGRLLYQLRLWERGDAPADAAEAGSLLEEHRRNVFWSWERGDDFATIGKVVQDAADAGLMVGWEPPVIDLWGDEEDEPDPQYSIEGNPADFTVVDKHGVIMGYFSTLAEAKAWAEKYLTEEEA